MGLMEYLKSDFENSRWRKMAVTLQGKIVDDHSTAHFEGKE